MMVAAQMLQASNRSVQSKMDSRDEVTANGETNQGPMVRVKAQLGGDPNAGMRNDVELLIPLLTPPTKK
ncbi:hypothetical protein ACFX1Z_022478 [Malus domestica]